MHMCVCTCVRGCVCANNLPIKRKEKTSIITAQWIYWNQNNCVSLALIPGHNVSVVRYREPCSYARHEVLSKLEV